MNDQKLDTLLRGWEVQPPPSLARSGMEGDGAWDESAAVIVEKARASAPAGGHGSPEFDSLLAAPSLEIEPGEPSQKSAGEKKMSDDRDPPSAARPSVRAGRPSLKELAERVSKTPPPPSVRAPDVAPMSAPATKVSPPPSAAERISAVPPSVPTSVRPPVAPISITHVEPVPSIAKTAPIDAAPVVAAANDAAPVSKGPPLRGEAALAAGTAPKRSSNTLWLAIGGGAVALAAAASIALYLNSKKTPSGDQTAAKPKTDTAQTAEVTTAAPAAPKDDAAPEVVQNDTPPPPSGVDLDSIGDATDSASPMFTGRLPVASSSPIASNDETDETKDDGPHRIEPNGTLDQAMEDAAGKPDEHKGQEPASTPTGPKNLPDQPPSGSVSAAIGSVRGAARGCVAGADKDSSATIVFGSSGAVQSVSVGGWAAGKPAAGCIQGAVSGARVEPFTKPSFPVTMTIRP